MGNCPSETRGSTCRSNEVGPDRRTRTRMTRLGGVLVVAAHGRLRQPGEAPAPRRARPEQAGARDHHPPAGRQWTQPGHRGADGVPRRQPAGCRLRRRNGRLERVRDRLDHQDLHHHRPVGHGPAGGGAPQRPRRRPAAGGRVSAVAQRSHGRRRDLFAWVAEGPPRSASRLAGGAVLFLDPLPCGFSVSYFVDEAQRCVAVVRVRRTKPT